MVDFIENMPYFKFSSSASSSSEGFFSVASLFDFNYNGYDIPIGFSEDGMDRFLAICKFSDFPINSLRNRLKLFQKKDSSLRLKTYYTNIDSKSNYPVKLYFRQFCSVSQVVLSGMIKVEEFTPDLDRTDIDYDGLISQSKPESFMFAIRQQHVKKYIDELDYIVKMRR